MKINIEIVDGKIVGIYGSDPYVEIQIFEDLSELTDEQADAIELEIASTPYILYQP